MESGLSVSAFCTRTRLDYGLVLDRCVFVCETLTVQHVQARSTESTVRIIVTADRTIRATQSTASVALADSVTLTGEEPAAKYVSRSLIIGADSMGRWGRSPPCPKANAPQTFNS